VFQELGHLLRAIREIKRLIVRERDPESLLAGACRTLLQIRGYLHVGFGLVRTRSWNVPPVTRSRTPADFLDGFSVSWSGKADTAVPAGEVIHTGQPWVCRNVATDPRFAAWQRRRAGCNCGVLAAIPLLTDGQVIGAMTVCADRPDSFHHEEVRLLEELASDLAFALIGHAPGRRRFARRWGGCTCSVPRVESAANAVAITDRDGVRALDQSRLHRTHRLVAGRMRASRTNLFKYGVQDPAHSQPMWKTILAGGVWRAEQIKRRKDGNLYTEECTITPVRQ
jgi:hypothetical protein